MDARKLTIKTALVNCEVFLFQEYGAGNKHPLYIEVRKALDILADVEFSEKDYGSGCDGIDCCGHCH
jgi:hypothetical protein